MCFLYVYQSITFYTKQYSIVLMNHRQLTNFPVDGYLGFSFLVIKT